MKTKLLIFVYIFFCSYVQLNAQTFSGGSGTYAAPYLISSVADLQALSTAVAAGTTYDGKWFKQTANIDFSGQTSYFTPIGYRSGTSTFLYFKGNYNGQNYKIINLSINNKITTNNGCALFGAVSGNDTIKNVVLQNPMIRNAAQNSAALIGMVKAGTLTVLINNRVIGGFVRSSNALTNIGTLIGNEQNSVTIRKCFSTCSIDTVATNSGVGGLAGIYASGTLSISDSYFAGKIISGGNNTGGLVYGNSALEKIKNCYSNVKIRGANTTNADAIVYGTAASITSTFGCSDSTTTAATGATAATTANMQTQSNYVGWDFVNTWGIHNGFPFLNPAQGTDTTLVPTPTANAATNITSSSMDISWTASAGATSYALDVATDAAFTSLVYNNTAVTGTTTTLSGLTASTQYYYRVRAVNVNGFTGDSNSITATTSVGTAISSPASSQLKVITDNGTLRVENVQAFMVYNVQGVKVAEVSKNATASVVDLKQGVYVVKSGNQIQKVSVK